MAFVGSCRTLPLTQHGRMRRKHPAAGHSAARMVDFPARRLMSPPGRGINKVEH